jgi:hypothetical protein
VLGHAQDDVEGALDNGCNLRPLDLMNSGGSRSSRVEIG